MNIEYIQLSKWLNVTVHWQDSNNNHNEMLWVASKMEWQWVLCGLQSKWSWFFFCMNKMMINVWKFFGWFLIWISLAISLKCIIKVEKFAFKFIRQLALEMLEDFIVCFKIIFSLNGIQERNILFIFSQREFKSLWRKL